jgi:hypothetical protein
MKASEPPILTTWLLERLAPRHQRDSLIGDLREQFHDGRSAWCYRRQVLTSVLAGAAATRGASPGGGLLRPAVRDSHVSRVCSDRTDGSLDGIATLTRRP